MRTLVDARGIIKELAFRTSTPHSYNNKLLELT